jgi:hypothetical protein
MNTAQLLCGPAKASINKRVEAYARGQMSLSSRPPAGRRGFARKARVVGLRALVNRSLFGLAAPSSERSSRTGGGV